MKYIDELCARRPHLAPIKKDIEKAFEILKECYESGHKVLICGNGGSASDSAHITGELMKSFKKKRPASDKFFEDLKTVIDDFTGKNNCNHGPQKLEEMKMILEQGLPTIDITSQVALNTAFINDKNADYMYANEVLGLGCAGDTLIAISTSGFSKNVVNATLVAKAKGLNIIAFTGKTGGKLKHIGDATIIAPGDETYLIQEEHIAIYHAICLDIEEEFF